MNKEQVLELRPELEDWADNVIKLWKTKIEVMGVGSSGDLKNSFLRDVIWHAGGDGNKIKFLFNYYGKFTDMGVGRGVKLYDRDAKISIGMTSRRPKMWFTEVFYKQIARLRYLMSDRMSENIQALVIDDMSRKIKKEDI